MGDLAWHLPTSERWFATGALGLRVPGVDPVPKDARPADPAGIADAADRSHALLLEAFRGQDDAWLAEEVEFYGRRMPREAIVGLMLRHGAHHRGQLTVYLRLAGGKVPGVYGPSADDAGGEG
jgi:uncharacterized damage-inducible protein DinB